MKMKKTKLLLIFIACLVFLIGCKTDIKPEPGSTEDDYIPTYKLGENKSEQEIKYDLILEMGEGIEWSSNNENVISTTGKVQRPSYDTIVTLGVLTESIYKQYEFNVIGYKKELKECYNYYLDLDVSFEASEYHSYNEYIDKLETLRRAIIGKNTYEEALQIMEDVKTAYDSIKPIGESTFFQVTIEGEGIEIVEATNDGKYPEGHEVLIKTTTTSTGYDVEKLFINGIQIAENDGFYKFIPFEEITVTATYFKSLSRGLDDPLVKEYYKGAGICATDQETFYSVKKVFTSYNPNYNESAQILETSDWDDSKGGYWCIYDSEVVTSRSAWNREHVWPQSRLGLPKTEHTMNKPYQRSQLTDTHNLRTIIRETNEERSNYFFVDPANSTGNYHIVDGLKFYPGDEHKGDVARIMLYMAIRYFGTITLTRYPSPSNYDKTAQMGDIDLFLKWHLEDPVDDFERKRNDTIFAYNSRANRNPFIDFPELFEPVWNYLIEVDNIRLGIQAKYEQTIEDYQTLRAQYFIRQRKYVI